MVLQASCSGKMEYMKAKQIHHKTVAVITVCIEYCKVKEMYRHSGFLAVPAALFPASTDGSWVCRQMLEASLMSVKDVGFLLSAKRILIHTHIRLRQITEKFRWLIVAFSGVEPHY